MFSYTMPNAKLQNIVPNAKAFVTSASYLNDSGFSEVKHETLQEADGIFWSNKQLRVWERHSWSIKYV